MSDSAHPARFTSALFRKGTFPISFPSQLLPNQMRAFWKAAAVFGPVGLRGPPQEAAENESQKQQTGAPQPINVPADEDPACMGNMFVCLIDCFLKTW